MFGMTKIPGFNGDYEINKAGDVYLNKVKKYKSVKDGYLSVNLCKDKYCRPYFLHRLLYITFVGEIAEGMQINHKDGNKFNNELSNLELVTPRENTLHAWSMGLASCKRGENRHTSKLKQTEVDLIPKLKELGLKNSQIARAFKISPSVIYQILTGKTWRNEKDKAQQKKTIKV